MRPLFFLLLACLLPAGPARSAPAMTALEAVRLLPKGVPEKVAIIAGYEGSPMPLRWHVLAYDEKEENGVHEYVVSGGELIASRTVSQFAETLRAEEAIGVAAVKVDADKVAKLAQQYAQANKQTPVTYNFELKRNGEEAVPLWRVTCLDGHGTVLGSLTVTATKGNVVAKDGFPIEPGSTAPKAPTESKERRAIAATTPKPRERKALPVDEPVAPPPTAEEPRRPGLFQRTGDSLQRVFTGRDPLER